MYPANVHTSYDTSHDTHQLYMITHRLQLPILHKQKITFSINPSSKGILFHRCFFFGKIELSMGRLSQGHLWHKVRWVDYCIQVEWGVLQLVMSVADSQVGTSGGANPLLTPGYNDIRILNYMGSLHTPRAPPKRRVTYPPNAITLLTEFFYHSDLYRLIYGTSIRQLCCATHAHPDYSFYPSIYTLILVIPIFFGLYIWQSSAWFATWPGMYFLSIYWHHQHPQHRQLPTSGPVKNPHSGKRSGRDAQGTRKGRRSCRVCT